MHQIVGDVPNCAIEWFNAGTVMLKDGHYFAWDRADYRPGGLRFYVIYATQ